MIYKDSNVTMRGKLCDVGMICEVSVELLSPLLATPWIGYQGIACYPSAFLCLNCHPFILVGGERLEYRTMTRQG